MGSRNAQSSGGEIAFATLAKIERAVAGIMAAIEDGMHQPSMKTRLAKPEREKAEIAARFVEKPADTPDVYPGVAKNLQAQG